MMLKLPLKVTEFARKHGVPWKSCLPFVDNSRALLVHRVYSVTTYKSARFGTHEGVHYWCGNCSSGSGVFTFLASLTGKKLLCARCEEKAVAAGLPSADELSGTHVHKGKLIAVQTCCKDEGANHE